MKIRALFCSSLSGIAENVSIDENGDRTTDYSLLDMNPETGNYEVRIEPCTILNVKVL